jgi:hypothetical protein
MPGFEERVPTAVPQGYILLSKRWLFVWAIIVAMGSIATFVSCVAWLFRWLMGA